MTIPITATFNSYTLGSSLSSSDIAIIIISTLAALFVVATIVICCCRTKLCRRGPTTDRKDHPSDSTMNLIPPIFYTEDMRDPLYQEDLRDRYKHRPSSEQ